MIVRIYFGYHFTAKGKEQRSDEKNLMFVSLSKVCLNMYCYRKLLENEHVWPRPLAASA